MIHLNPNNKGVDQQINNLMNWMYPEFVKLGWSDYECYGRAFRNKNPRNDKVGILEIPINSKDYKDVTMDDKHTCSSFFVLKNIEFKALAEATVSIIFQINIKKLYNSTQTIEDEKAINDILTVLHYNPSLFKVGKIKRGVSEVYSEYNINTQDRDSMSSYSVFSFDAVVTYDFNYV